MDKIEKIIYINLESRKDRFEDINNEFDLFGFSREKIERFEAIYDPRVLVGCGLSHLGALIRAKESGCKNVLILEDDFEIIVDQETFYSSLSYFFDFVEINNEPWDVLMLAYNTTLPSVHKTEDVPTDEMNVLGKIRYAQTASAYLVNSDYLDCLIQNLKEGNDMLQATGAHWIYANDVFWKSLQEKDNWFYFKNRLSVQRRSYPENKLYGC